MNPTSPTINTAQKVPIRLLLVNGLTSHLKIYGESAKPKLVTAEKIPMTTGNDFPGVSLVIR